jgi:hypothetical protein
VLARFRNDSLSGNILGMVTLLVALAGAALFASPATAAASVYEGHIKGVPEAGFDLRFAKTDGKLFLNAIDTTDIPVTCENGPQTITGNTQFSPTPEARVRNRAFDVRQDSGKGDFLRVAGELKRGGRAAGIYKQRVTFGPPLGVCRTGKLEWVAKKL